MGDTEITVVGGGLAGLVAAIECAEAGEQVRVLEARSRVGGRATSTSEPFVANLGPHALYSSTELWRWLKARDLHQPARTPRPTRLRFRWEGDVRRTPPRVMTPFVGLGRAKAPVDVDLRTWLTERHGEGAARAIAGATSALTFDHDPGRLSAAFVVERIGRILISARPTARYVVGGWQAMVDRLADHARRAGVVIETGARVEPSDLDDLGPTIVAVEPGAARRLLGDDGLRAESPAVALLDIGLERRAGDPYLLVDLDDVSFVDRFTAVIPSLAPDGHELVQAHAGLRPGESLESGIARLEAVLDAGFDGWREREVWRRRAVVRESTGALDLPGSTWRDRVPVHHGDGRWLAGDWVAAPGHLAEVSCTSAMAAARAAIAYARGEHQRAGYDPAHAFLASMVN
jgi:phytoene dehydrogenase-like protein